MRNYLARKSFSPAKAEKLHYTATVIPSSSTHATHSNIQTANVGRKFMPKPSNEEDGKKTNNERIDPPNLFEQRSARKRGKPLIAAWFQAYGHFLAKWPLPFLLGPIILSLAVSPLYMYMTYEGNVLDLFGATEAEYRVEGTAHTNFTSLPSQDFSRRLEKLRQDYDNAMTACEGRKKIVKRQVDSTALTERKQKGSRRLHYFMLAVYTFERDKSVTSDNCLDRILIAHDHIRKTMHINTSDGDALYFRDFCSKKCGINNQWLNGRELLLKDNSNNPNLRLSYPIFDVFGEEYPIGSVFYGVTLKGALRKLVDAKAVVLGYGIDFDAKNETLLKNYETMVKAVRDYAEDFFNGPHLPSSQRFESFFLSPLEIGGEYDNIRKEAMKYWFVTLGALVIWILLSNASFKAADNKALVGLSGMLSVFLAIFTSFGIIFGLGYPFNALIVVSPFLVLCIGIDDAFLILGAFRLTNHRLPVSQRIAETLGEAATSITLTTLTDLLCLAVGGYFAMSKGLFHFCMFTCIEILIDYLYCITFFAAILVYSARKEQRIRAKEHGSKIAPLFDEYQLNNTNNDSEDIENQKTIPHSQHTQAFPMAAVNGTFSYVSTGSPEVLIRNRENVLIPQETRSPWSMNKFMKNYYSRMLLNVWTKYFAILSYILYFLTALTGCSNLQIDMSLSKMLLDSSVYQEYFTLLETYIIRDNLQINVIIRRPPDFSSAANRLKFMSFVHELEAIKFSSGPLGTSLWLKDYTRVVSYWAGTPDHHDLSLKDTDFYAFNFLEVEKPKLQADVRLNDNLDWNCSLDNQVQVDKAKIIKMFKFTVAYYGAKTWEDRTKLIQTVRNVIKKHSEFSPTMSTWVSLYTDQRIGLVAAATSSLGYACIAICLATGILFALEFFSWSEFASSVFRICRSMYIVSYGLLSVEMGVIGFLNFWGCDLDILSVISLLICVGLAVDFIAHICHRYEHSECETAEERVVETLESVGWPIMQAAVSTVGGIIVMAVIPSYLVRVIWKSVVLVVLFGLYHGLFLIPVLYLLLDKRKALNTHLVS